MGGIFLSFLRLFSVETIVAECILRELNVGNKQHLHFHSCPEEPATTGGAPEQSLGLFCSVGLINGVSVSLRDTSGQTLADSRVY